MGVAADEDVGGIKFQTFIATTLLAIISVRQV